MERLTNPARLAGLFYLIIIVAGIWSEVGVRGAIVVPGDAIGTADNLRAAEGVFRLALMSDAVMALCDVAVAVLFFSLFRTVHEGVARAAMVFRLIQAAILGANLLNHAGALMVLKSGMPEAEAWAAYLLGLHSLGYDLGLIFFGVNSLLTGWLIWTSGFLPRVIGGGIGAAGLVYLAGSTVRVIAPDLVPVFAPAYLVPLLAELSLALWLTVFAVRRS